MQLHSLGQPFSGHDAPRNRIAESVLAVVLLCASAAAPAQSIYKHVDALGHARYTDRPEAVDTSTAAPAVASAARTGQEDPATRTESASAISGRGPHSLSRSRKIDQNEASRRLLQAQRALARGPDIQHGEPPQAEKIPGARRTARLLKLGRNVQAAEARTREVYAQGYAANAVSPAVPAPMVVAGGDGNIRTRREAE